MNTLFSPAELAIIVHYHAHCEDWDFGNAMPTFLQSTRDRMVELGLLLDHGFSAIAGPRLTPTDRIHAHVEILCATPLPVQKWVSPSAPVCGTCGEPIVPGLGRWVHLDTGDIRCHINTTSEAQPKDKSLYG